MKVLSLLLTLAMISTMALPISGCKHCAPVADFAAAPTSGYAPLTVRFTDMSHAEMVPDIVSWSWDFDDGNGSNEQNPSHVFCRSGSFTVSLKVTNDKGMTGMATRTDYIRVEPGSAGGEEQTVMLPGGVPLVMIWIPAGSFLMGRGPIEGGYDWEYPLHQVTVPGFWMGKYELTQAQWKAVMGAVNPSFNQGDNLPLESVSWNEFKEGFLPALNQATGLTFRLPSEAEWEYACRAKTETRFYWGDDAYLKEIDNYAWHSGNSGGKTHEVGTRLPNAFGLHDMSGNVLEWCEDDWHDNYVGAPANGEAWVDSPRGPERVHRGGSWYWTGGDCRSAYRFHLEPSTVRNNFGFRLVRQ